MRALAAFGAPMNGIRDEVQPGGDFQIGGPPGRIDVLTDRSGITFAAAWPERDPDRFGDLTVAFLGRKAFIPTGRLKDPADIEDL